MQKTASKAVVKVHRKPKPKSVEDLLAEHLKIAEEHLIQAVELFSKSTKPDRRAEYVSRLERAQEIVTGLFREELVRIRGPVRRGRK